MALDFEKLFSFCSRRGCFVASGAERSSTRYEEGDANLMLFVEALLSEGGALGEVKQWETKRPKKH